MTNKCQSWFFLVEGDTEKALLKELREHHNLIIKEIRKFNLWNANLMSLLPMIKPNMGVVVIFDTDTLNNINDFIRNLSLLSRRVKRLFLIQQNKNFEDELCFACNNCTQTNLFKLFAQKNTNIRSVSEFKRNFLQCTKRIKRLEEINFSHARIWSKHHELISQLLQYNARHIEFTQLISLIEKVKR